jgi:arylsulfatase A-like enzyme
MKRNLLMTLSEVRLAFVYKKQHECNQKGNGNVRSTSICVLLLLLMTSVGDLYAAEVLSRPNIVIILADDMGYGDCGVYNPQSKIATPNIDQLAKEGLRFTDAHSASVTCTASRYGLLTGINPARTGVRNTLLRQGNPIIDEKETTLAAVLKDHGYITKMVGKWHLGFEMMKTGRRPEFDFSRPLLGGPLDRGFDYFFGIHSSPGSSPRVYIEGRNSVSSAVKKGGGYVQEEVAPTLCKDVISIIREHAVSKKEKPLFLYYASPIPHTPHVPVDKFKGKSGAGAYGDYMLQLDDEVRQVNAVLKETGLDENTILIFTSDNGASQKVVGEHDHMANGIFRGHKASAYEGGHRIPFIIKWPGRIQAASVSKTAINHTDIFATFAELLGVDLGKSYPGCAEDSHSFLPALFDPTKRFSHPVMVNSVKCIRIDDWKLVDNPKGKEKSKGKGKGKEAVNQSCYELYNLKADPAEEKDVSNENPERRTQLVKLFEQFIANRRLKPGAK